MVPERRWLFFRRSKHTRRVPHAGAGRQRSGMTGMTEMTMTVPETSEGQVLALEPDTATELATFVVGLVILVATPTSLPVAHDTEPQSLRDVVKRLRNAPSHGEQQRLRGLATTIDQNVTFWIGASSHRNAALSAIRHVLPALAPDPRRLKAADLDPKRIAFMVVQCARTEAPADFAEADTAALEQTSINVHILRTMILRSLEHLQRVALREWAERSFEASQTVGAPDAAPTMDLSHDPADDRSAEHPPNLNVALDEPISDVPMQVGDDTAPVLDNSLPSAKGRLETEPPRSPNRPTQ